jgi:hypothetical protein
MSSEPDKAALRRFLPTGLDLSTASWSRLLPGPPEFALLPRAGGGTSLRWCRTYTGLSREGNALLEGITEEVFRKQTDALAQSLARYAMQLEGQ